MEKEELAEMMACYRLQVSFTKKIGLVSGFGTELER